MDRQAGLEVASYHQSGSTGPQVVPPQGETAPIPTDEWQAIHGTHQKENVAPEQIRSPPSKEDVIARPHGLIRSWKCWDFISVAILIVSVIAISILATKLHPVVQNTSQAGTPKDVPAGDSGQVIRRGARLDVSGYETASSGLTARLLYEGTDGVLRYMDRGAGGNWSMPTQIDRVRREIGAPIAISADLQFNVRHYSPPWSPFTNFIGAQVSGRVYHLYYANKDGKISGLLFDTSLMSAGDPDQSTLRLDAQLGNQSSLAAYWPYVLSQDQNTGQMVWYGYRNNYLNNSVVGYANLTSNFTTTLGSPRTSFVILPVSSWWDIYVGLTLGAGFFYRNQEGLLAYQLAATTFVTAPTLVQWNRTEFPRVELPGIDSYQRLRLRHRDRRQGGDACLVPRRGRRHPDGLADAR
ncbi:uncharacterized protein PG998_014924 [Apiospora kogelbergensis]|uniref:uncharacterized protein n=1 Tax=Apiospora kogelbergensis TaxID=1337665 RepID=UPI00312D473E